MIAQNATEKVTMTAVTAEEHLLKIAKFAAGQERKRKIKSFVIEKTQKGGIS